ncbi:ribokinase [Acidisoma cellulosilytica]|uniref:Ribokinase n=1 Tax=Acidisoma cellulosilyticum TaxID=2802395 RepID=A0A963Z6G6_9PROT|nr:ribokinase [Acidisoma cellulosilyticum]MCB8883513.1 ribokinase [Acidisoma cellulosilyticum]
MSVVYVLGNAGLDLSLGMARLPAPGETLVAHTATRGPGGKGLNQAVTAGRAGADVIFTAPVGDDREAEQLRAVLATEPLIFEPISLAYPTDLSVIMVTPGGENSIATVGLAADGLDVAAAERFAGRAGPDDWLLLQGNLSLAATRAAMLATQARVIFNTAPLRWPVDDLLPLCDLVIANGVEAADITGAQGADAAQRLLALGARSVIITLGREGAILASDGTLILMPAPAVTAVDTTGAGDTLCGVLAAALARGDTVRQALQRGQDAAAVTVTRPGAYAALPSRAELSRP